jgi:hypothetical protein
MCADICMCEDKKCASRTRCYRFTAEQDEHRQSYFAKSPRGKTQTRCSEFWSNSGTPDPTDYTVQKKISMVEYNAICDRIIGLGLPVHKTLIKLLAEAGKYEVSRKQPIISDKKVDIKADKKGCKPCLRKGLIADKKMDKKCDKTHTKRGKK